MKGFLLDSKKQKDGILDIINDMTNNGKNKEIIKMFLHGYCYDLALILWRNIDNINIYYIYDYFGKNKGGHYVVEDIAGNFYDITGEIDLDLNNYVYEIDDTLSYFKNVLKYK